MKWAFVISWCHGDPGYNAWPHSSNISRRRSTLCVSLSSFVSSFKLCGLNISGTFQWILTNHFACESSYSTDVQYYNHFATGCSWDQHMILIQALSMMSFSSRYWGGLSWTLTKTVSFNNVPFLPSAILCNKRESCLSDCVCVWVSVCVFECVCVSV